MTPTVTGRLLSLYFKILTKSLKILMLQQHVLIMATSYNLLNHDQGVGLPDLGIIQI